MIQYRIVIVTGLSGSGKSTAIKALEDIGYFCIDNLPVLLLEKFIMLCIQSYGDLNRFAFVMDAREHQFVEQWNESVKAIERMGYPVEILYLEASDEALIRRFSETRRKHPLGGTNVVEGIENEKQMMSELRHRANLILDTSGYTVHQLKKIIQEHFGTGAVHMEIYIGSFGYKYGIPQESDFVFDARFLANPYFDEKLRPLTGLDRAVKSYVLEQKDAQSFIERINDLLRFVIPLCVTEGKAQLSIFIGCTGGKHRSVVIAEEIKSRLSKMYELIYITHRDINK